MTRQPFRPKNETDQDIDNEDRIATALADAWGLEQVKLSDMLYNVDRCLYHKVTNALHSIVEIKCYNEPLRYHAVLSIAKHLRLCQLAQAMGVPAYLAIGIKNGPIITHRVMNLGHYQRHMIRNGKRNQNGDLEPGIEIDPEAFSEIAPSW